MQTKHHDLISLGQTWHQWWDIFSQNFIKWIIISFAPWFVTYLIFILLLGKITLALNEATHWNELISLQNSTIYFLIVGFLLIVFLQVIGTIALVISSINNKKIVIKQVFSQALKIFWPYLLMSILLGLIYFLIILIGYLAVTLLSTFIGLFSTDFLNQIFAWLQIIPFILVLITSALFIFAPYHLIDQKSSAWQAVKSSFLLIKGHFWPVVLRLFIAYAVIFTLALFLNLVPWVGPIIAVILTAPALAIYLYILYQDLKTLKKI